MKAKSAFIVDLTEIDGEGDFPCPNCGAVISPDDESEESYTIYEVKTKGDSLEELIILCVKCGSTIHLVGFEGLSESEGSWE